MTVVGRRREPQPKWVVRVWQEKNGITWPPSSSTIPAMSQEASAAAASDERFATTSWDAQDVREDHSEDRPIPVLSTEELEAYKKKQQKRGIIYLSRIPPGMTPAKVRHIFSQFGEVGRIYLQPQHAASKKSTSRYSEGWIEFLSKRVAKTTAEMLNAQPIGALGGAAHSSRRSSSASVINRWKDDIWTMKYLKGFRWPMLMEQMTHERASHAARLRMELSQSAHEQRDYLRKVERSRRQRKREARDEAPSAPARVFQQRTPIYRDVRDQRAQGQAGGHGERKQDMEQVLSQIF